MTSYLLQLFNASQQDITNPNEVPPQPILVRCGEQLGFVITPLEGSLPTLPEVLLYLQESPTSERVRVEGIITIENPEFLVGVIDQVVPQNGNETRYLVAVVNGVETTLPAYQVECPPHNLQIETSTSQDDPEIFCLGLALSLSDEDVASLPVGTTFSYYLLYLLPEGTFKLLLHTVPFVIEEDPYGIQTTLDLDVNFPHSTGSYTFQAIDTNERVIAQGEAQLPNPNCLRMGILLEPPCLGDLLDPNTAFVNYRQENGGLIEYQALKLNTYYLSGTTILPTLSCEQKVKQDISDEGYEIMGTCPEVVYDGSFDRILRVLYATSTDQPDFSSNNDYLFFNSIEITPSSNCGTGGDPHVVCIDNSRIDLYEEGYYRLFDNLSEPEQEQERVVINGQVVRDPFTKEDQYSQIWVHLPEEDYLLSFYPECLRVSQRKKGKVSYTEVKRLKEGKWLLRYQPSQGPEHVFQAELSQRTFLLSLEGKAQGRYQGLFAGRILPLTGLEDLSKHLIEELICSSRYRYNALLCGSAQPHLLSLEKKRYTLKQGLYRLLQNKDLTVNVEVDQRGALSKVVIFSQQGIEKWTYSGPFWELRAQRNGTIIPTHDFLELRTEDYLLRVQGNGSISFATNTLCSGLVKGEMLVVKHLYSTKILQSTELLSLCSVSTPSQKNSLYQLLVEPVM